MVPKDPIWPHIYLWGPLGPIFIYFGSWGPQLIIYLLALWVSYWPCVSVDFWPSWLCGAAIPDTRDGNSMLVPRGVSFFAGKKPPEAPRVGTSYLPWLGLLGLPCLGLARPSQGKASQASQVPSFQNLEVVWPTLADVLEFMVHPAKVLYLSAGPQGWSSYI